MAVEMLVDSVCGDPRTPRCIIVLKEVNRDRYLLITTGVAEADAIAIRLTATEVPRPLTHDLLRNVITLLGGRITHVLVLDLREDIFYARVVLDVNGAHREVDARPSDAIALALRAKVPILVEESVLDRVALEPEARLRSAMGQREPERQAERGGKQGEPAVDERQLAVYREVIDQLDLDGFGRKS